MSTLGKLSARFAVFLTAERLAERQHGSAPQAAGIIPTIRGLRARLSNSARLVKGDTKFA
jgi:hypothetical protein